MLRRLLFLVMIFAVAFFSPAVSLAEPVRPASHPWIPTASVPPELRDGLFPVGVENRPAAIEQVVKALGRPYTWIWAEEKVPLFFRDAAGYGYVQTIRLGVILDGTEAEAQQRAARGLFDRVYYVRAKAPYRDGQWQAPIVKLEEPPSVTVPELPRGGPAAPSEAVRGWDVPFAGETPVPPVGSGLNLADQKTLPPILQQLAIYPPEAIMGNDPTDINLLVSTQPVFRAAVVAGHEATTILAVRTVNAYQRAPWMDGLWQGRLLEMTDHLDDAARAAGVAPDRVATQRLLLQRTADGWQVLEAQTYSGGYELAVAPPTASDRMIGALDTAQIQVPARMRVRDPEPVDPMTGAAATAGGTVILLAWAGARLLGRTGQVLGGETPGSRVAKAFSDALDWALRPVEEPLERLMDRLGIAKYLHDDPAEVGEALRAGGACSACGGTVREGWSHCTECGARLAAPVAAVAAGVQVEPPMPAPVEAEAVEASVPVVVATPVATAPVTVEMPAAPAPAAGGSPVAREIPATPAPAASGSPVAPEIPVAAATPVAPTPPAPPKVKKRSKGKKAKAAKEAVPELVKTKRGEGERS